MATTQGDDDEQFMTVNKKGYGYVIFVVLYEILVCLMYALLFGYSPELEVDYNVGDLFLISGLTILALVGFGLINSYITNAGFSGIALTLLIFAFTIQHYFMMRAFWDKAGAHDPSSEKQWDGVRYERISLTNTGQDRGMTAELTHASMVDAIACAISMIVAYSSLVGRIQAFQVALMTLFGSWLYEVNNQLLWRFFMTDIGYGMRIFLFGSIVGIVSSLILGRKDTTVDHPYYMSVYSSRSLGLVGLVVAVCTFPLLVVGSLYQTSINYSYILFIATLNMYLAVGSGILGAFSASALFNGKIFLHDLIFSGLAGGIVFSSSADLNRNPAFPLAAGFLISFVVTAFHSKFLRKTNQKGVTFSLGHINMYMIPGLFSGIISGIMHGINQGTLENYVMRRHPDRTFVQQGGFQILGVLLTVGIALFTGALLGGLFKVINKQNYYQQFDDNAIFELDRDDEKRYEDDGEVIGSSSNGE